MYFFLTRFFIVLCFLIVTPLAQASNLSDANDLGSEDNMWNQLQRKLAEPHCQALVSGIDVETQIPFIEDDLRGLLDLSEDEHGVFHGVFALRLGRAFKGPASAEERSILLPLLSKHGLKVVEAGYLQKEGAGDLFAQGTAAQITSLLKENREVILLSHKREFKDAEKWTKLYGVEISPEMARQYGFMRKLLNKSAPETIVRVSFRVSMASFDATKAIVDSNPKFRTLGFANKGGLNLLGIGLEAKMADVLAFLKENPDLDPIEYYSPLLFIDSHTHRTLEAVSLYELPPEQNNEPFRKYKIQAHQFIQYIDTLRKSLDQDSKDELDVILSDFTLLEKRQGVDAAEVRAFVEAHKKNGVFITIAQALKELRHLESQMEAIHLAMYQEREKKRSGQPE